MKQEELLASGGPADLLEDEGKEALQVAHRQTAQRVGRRRLDLLGGRGERVRDQGVRMDRAGLKSLMFQFKDKSEGSPV